MFNFQFKRFVFLSDTSSFVRTCENIDIPDLCIWFQHRYRVEVHNQVTAGEPKSRDADPYYFDADPGPDPT